MTVQSFANGKSAWPISDHWENHLLEVFDALWDDLVDPAMPTPTLTENGGYRSAPLGVLQREAQA